MRTIHLTVVTLINTVLLVGTTLHQLSAPAFAQPSVTTEVYGGCNVVQADSNGTFVQNLNAVANSLISNSSRVLYSLLSSTRSGNSSNYVYAMYQCRGDIDLSDCSTCVAKGIAGFLNTGLTPSLCGYIAMGVRVQYQGCYVRYENYVFSNASAGTFIDPICTGSVKESSRVYRENLATALEDSATAAPQHPQFGYNATSVGSGSNTAYALAQCLGYLNATGCATCLAQLAANYSNICNGFMSGQVYFIDCYYLFGNTSLALTLPSPVVSPATSPSQTTIAGSPLPERRHHTAAIVGSVVGSLALITIIAALAICFVKRQRKSRAELHKQRDVGELLLPKIGARRFSLQELQDATNNFNLSNKLGEGGFGPVYQGRLKSGRDVAIKMLSSQSRQGKSEFVNEVNLITTVQHRNLIELLGYCEEDNKQLLVYEYLPNRSLDLCLFDVSENSALDWHTRFGIIVGVARGLRYLHEDSPVRIIHRDIKASNILLDNNLDPKISDFGLARLFGDDASHLTTRVVGTLGYLAPEYAIGGQLSEKADVYSFGLVVLEILSGRKVVETKAEPDKQNLLDWTWALYEKQQQLQILDERVQTAGKGLDGSVNKHVDVGEVVRVLHVALLCTQLQPQTRPSMSEVHDMLCGQSEILNIPTKPMTVGMLSPIPNLLHDGSSSVLTNLTVPSQPSMNSIYSYDANSMSQVEAR